MGVSNYKVSAATLAVGRTQDYELSILTGVDSFAYIIRDRSENRLLAYRSYDFDDADRRDWPAAVTGVIETDTLLADNRYGKTVLGWNAPTMTLVPDPLYDADRATAYLDSLAVIGLHHAVRTLPVQELGSTLVFAEDRERLSLIEHHFSTPPAQHVSAGLLTAWAARSRRQGHASISCTVRGGRLLLAGHQAGNLEYYNSFAYDSSQDAVYYLLLAYDQCRFSPARDPLYLSGEILITGELYNQFYRYLEDIRFSQYGAPPGVPPELADLPSHLYFDLLCLG